MTAYGGKKRKASFAYWGLILPGQRLPAGRKGFSRAT